VKKPVSDREFWRQRLVEAHVSGRGLHTAIYDTDPETWTHIQNETRGYLLRYLLPGTRMLDAGCGYGAAAHLCPGWASYLGVDSSPDLLEIARKREPGCLFVQADLGDMPFLEDKAVDVCLARSLKKMLVDNLGQAAWERVLKELRRVSKAVLVLEYEAIDRPEVIT